VPPSCIFEKLLFVASTKAVQIERFMRIGCHSMAGSTGSTVFQGAGHHYKKYKPFFLCRYPEDLKGPQAVIIVPHRELGVQICMLVYRLLGGSVNAGVPGEKATMFSYFGPKGIQVRGCLDKEEVLRVKNAGYVARCHVVVGTPDCLAEVLQEPEAYPIMQHTQVPLL
jgi:hypothetical protein